MSHGWLSDALSGDSVLIGLELLVLGLVVASLAHLLASRAKSLVYAWAIHGGWEITRLRRCHVVAGGRVVLPGIPVYRVSVRSRSGRERAALVRVGNLMYGPLSDEVAIEWVENAGR